ncbi:MAG: hypothetical protein IT303_17730 [Dehalococcoidia bacterium]|nr:hypothetical protein [Dehalococcoidia bacterium]
MLNLTACCWSTLGLDRESVAALVARVRREHPGGAVIESCQRLEAYSAVPCTGADAQRFEGEAAVAHLAEVAAGLHSVVLGEAQILGQVRAGLAAGPAEVRRATTVAVAAARELRAAVRFDSHAGHLLDRALKVAGMPAAGSVLVLGTGQMGRLVASRAKELGFERVVIAGRRRPDDLPADVTYTTLARVRDLDGVFDVVAGCLGSSAEELATSALPASRLFLDLGTPPNFRRAAGDGVLGLAELLADERTRPHAMRRRAELTRQLGEMLDARLRQAEAGRSPVGALRFEVERVRQRELARMRRLHPEVPADVLETMTRSLVNQLFHLPSARLKEAGDAAFGQRVAELFGP